MKEKTRYADLEMAIRLTVAKTQKPDERSYAIHFRFNNVDDEAEQASDPDPVVSFRPESIRDADPTSYGQRLGSAIFTADVTKTFVKFRHDAGTHSLRVRISIESSAPELQALHWETLRDPELPDVPFFMGEHTIVSRFLTSGQDWRPVRLRPRADLTALVAIANPQKLAGFQLAPVPVAEELRIARQVMSPGEMASADAAKIRISELAPGGPISLNDLTAELQKGYDILYLVCHGALDDGEPYLFLDETEEPTRGSDLVQRIRELDYRPRLVVLASCQSAGKGGASLSGLGPRLAEAGVPAVVAMQGNIYMDTASEFMKRFFGALMLDGQIDRAMSVARGAVRDRDDFWMPVLFLRLRHGCLWYVPGFQGGEKSEFEQWSTICGFVQRGQCVPIIGPDVAEHIYGDTGMLAADVATAERCPLDQHDSHDMAKVAQYLATKGGLDTASATFRKAFRARLNTNAERILGRNVRSVETPDVLNQLVDRMAADDADPAKRDPVRIVAGLSAKVFINAANDTLLETCIRRTPAPGAEPATMKQPVVLIANWRDETVGARERHDFSGDASVDKPTLYYVFGKREKPETGRLPTWVLTEDDFFDYLIRSTRYNVMPGVVAEALVTGSLLFLGFPLDDWKFRVLFRMICAKGGASMMSGKTHLGVQVDPGETTFADAKRAKMYLQRYFTNSKIDIYWGTATDFLRELKVHLDNAPPLEAEE